jgi:GxxExxY protein
MTFIRKKDLLYPELSYQIIGLAFGVYNEIGWGHKEKIYQDAFAVALSDLGLKFEREKLVKVKYKGKDIGKEFLDFVVDGKIIVELKVRPRFGYVHIDQVVSYLKGSSRLDLAIIIYFLKDGVRYRRIIGNK